MKILAFKLKWKFWHFRRFYTTTSPLTFSFPPFTVIRGLIWAILWKEKDSYNEEFAKIKLGVEIVNPVEKTMIWLNLTNTKTWSWYTQVRQETLLNPEYIIYVWDENFNEYEKLKQNLEKKESVYTPYLGLAMFIADIYYIWEEEWILQEVENVNIDSIVPIEYTNNGKNIKIKENQNLEFEKVPYFMDNERNLKKLQEFVFDTAWTKNNGRVKLKKVKIFNNFNKKIILI